MAPVPLSIEVPQIKTILKPKLDSRQAPGDFPGDKCFSPHGGFVVKQDAIASEKTVSLPVVDRNPVGI